MSIYENIRPIDLEKIQTYDLASRPSKVTYKDFAIPLTSQDSLADFVNKLPKILAVNALREIANAIKTARELRKPIIWGLGGHVIKTGLAPLLIDLMDRGFVSAIAVNGSVLVHDAEIAMAGFTSEDVDATLGDGDFGAARETGELINEAAKSGTEGKIGLGESIGKLLTESNPPNEKYSLICHAYKNKIPLTAHLTIGTDIGNFHPSCDGGALGAASHTDFRLFCSLVGEMNEGGVYLNYGSAVTLPEIFLKAVTVVRNISRPLRNFTTANFDFIQHYRPLTNVVRRPTAGGAGRGFAITGHHELTLPLLAAFIICEN